MDATPLNGEDRCGVYAGAQAIFACATDLQVEWNAIVYASHPVAALWMRVTNVSSISQHLLRLLPLSADPHSGSAIDCALRPEKALILNNGMWMDTPQSEWRVPVRAGWIPARLLERGAG